MPTFTCVLCGRTGEPSEQARIRSNVRRFRDQKFLVWRCVDCGSLHCEEVKDLPAYYEDYPLRREDRLGYFVNRWLGIVLDRLVEAGLNKSDSLLDYGCGTGLLLEFLRSRGYANCVGFDLYVADFNRPEVLTASYDCIVNFDVIEHVESPRALVAKFTQILKPGGLLCIQTPRADGIRLSDPEEFIHTLHMPYHVHILSEKALTRLCVENGLVVQSIHYRWFRDSRMPCASRRFIERFMRSHGNDMDSAFEPPKLGIVLATPALWFYSLFGPLLPSKKKDYMMIMLRKPNLAAHRARA